MSRESVVAVMIRVYKVVRSGTCKRIDLTVLKEFDDN